MNKAELAYVLAKRRIARAIANRETSLSFRDGACRALESLPPEIAQATAVEMLNLNNTMISDISSIAAMNRITRLSLSNSQVTDLSPIAELKELSTLYLMYTQPQNFNALSALANLKILNLEGSNFADLNVLPRSATFQSLDMTGSHVNDLSPILNLTFSREIGGVGVLFNNTPATKYDGRIAKIATKANANARLNALLNYLKDLPPVDETLAKNNVNPITVTAVLEAQDQTGWRFSPTHGALELFILNSDDTAQQRKMAEIVKQRLRNLLDKLSSGNHYGIRLDTLTEANLFNDLLNDDESTYSANALALWASLIALGGQLEANDAGQATGRDPFDLLKPDDRSALQTFLAVASGFVRSFEDTKDLDDSVVAFGRTALPIELLSNVLGKAVEQALISAGSAALIQDVAKLAAQEGTQSDKAHAVTATGSKNLVMTAALVGSVSGGIVGGITSDIGTDLSDHYELSEKVIGFIDSIPEELDQLIKGLSPDERANLVSILKDFEARRLAK